MLETAIAAVFMVATVMLLLRLLTKRRKPKARSAPGYKGVSHHKTSGPKIDPRYRAVSCSGHCPAVDAVRDQRFLERDAPAFPLPGCTAARCDCVYQHHNDRRNGRKDRRGLSQMKEEFFGYSGNTDRRGRRGRRASDFAIA